MTDFNLSEVRNELTKFYPHLSSDIAANYISSVSVCESVKGCYTLLKEYEDGVKRAFMFDSLEASAAARAIELVGNDSRADEICKHTNKFSEMWVKVDAPTTFAIKNNDKAVTTEPISGYLFERRNVDMSSAKSILAMYENTLLFIDVLNGTIKREIANIKLRQNDIKAYFTSLIIKTTDTKDIIKLQKDMVSVLSGQNHDFDNEIKEWVSNNK